MAGIFGNRIVERLWVGVTRRPVAFLTSSIILLTSSLLASCGPDGNQFEMSGKFKGFSQGELYLYATDGPSQKLDTIAVVNGTFDLGEKGVLRAAEYTDGRRNRSCRTALTVARADVLPHPGT